MPGKRESASRVFGTLGLSRAVGAVRSAAVRDLRVLGYHRVLREFDEPTFPFDIELVSASQADFEWQMQYVARHFTPVSCQQVVDALHHGKALPRRAAMVTFDDGFRDNHEVAFPVLRRLGVPAMFFISTGYIGSRKLFWFDRVVHLLLHSLASRIELKVLELSIEPTHSMAARRADARRLLARLKLVPDADRLLALAQLEQAVAVPADKVSDDSSFPMNWAQIREMADAGMEFGSHSVTHPILSRIADAERLREELEGSKARIELETGRPVTALAYPVGGAGAFNDQVLAATRQAGYRFAFTYLSGVNKPASAAPFLLKRLHVERYTSRRMFEAALQLPEVFAPS